MKIEQVMKKYSKIWVISHPRSSVKVKHCLMTSLYCEKYLISVYYVNRIVIPDGAVYYGNVCNNKTNKQT